MCHSRICGAHIELRNDNLEDSMPDNQSTSLERIAPAMNDHFAGRREQPATGQDLYNMGVMIDGNFSALALSISSLDQKLSGRMDRLESRMDALEARFDTFRIEIESMLNRKMMQFLYMQLGISLALFSALFTALYFSLSPR